MLNIGKKEWSWNVAPMVLRYIIWRDDEVFELTENQESQIPRASKDLKRF